MKYHFASKKPNCKKRKKYAVGRSFANFDNGPTQYRCQFRTEKCVLKQPMVIFMIGLFQQLLNAVFKQQKFFADFDAYAAKILR